MRHVAILFTGLFWLTVGLFLLIKGYSLSTFSLFLLALVIGFLKGRFILRKTAMRIAGRILDQKEPITLRTLYPLSYWLLIGLMMSMGFAFNFFALPNGMRGFIDSAIGFALVTGSIFYFKIGISKPSLPEKKTLL